MNENQPKPVGNLNELTVEERELGAKPIGKLVPLYCLPLILGSFIVGFQLVVDCVILATGVSLEALAAIGILFPYFLIMAALYDFMGPGGAALITFEMGKGNFDKARKACANSILYCFVICAVIAILSYIFKDAVIWGLGASEELYADAVAFLNIFLAFFPFMTTGVVVYFCARAAGKPLMSAVFNIIPPILAMVIEYYVVFGLGFGIEASALCAIVALCPNMLLLLWFLFSKGNMHLKASDFKVDWGIIRQISVLGFPSCTLQLFYAIVMVFAANILASLGASVEHYAAYSIIDAYIYYFLTFIVFGFGLGIQPIVSFNYTRSHARTFQTLKITYVAGIVTLVVFTGLLYIGMDGITGLLGVLNATPGYEEYLGKAIGLYIWGIPVLTITTTTAFFLQAAERAWPATLIIFVRAFVFTVPMLYIMTGIMGIDGLWVAFPMAEVLSAVFALAVLRWQIKKIKAEGEVERIAEEAAAVAAAEAPEPQAE
ncbi:MAG: MATE family efflux transporter [Bacillota bacterium]|nr:MATE family efflux transporter [Bacillota bacterium]